MRRLAISIALVAAAGLTLSACGSSSKTSTAPTTSTSTSTSSSAASGGVVSGATTVNIKNFAFSPSALTVKVGTKVTFIQDDSTVHTATDTGVFDSGNLSKGQSYTFTFAKPGTYHYICSIHTYMNATITVVA